MSAGERIQRGRIFTTKPRVYCICGECGTEFTLPDMYESAHKELDKHAWRYTNESGWVCPRCWLLPRLAHDAPNRQH